MSSNVRNENERIRDGLDSNIPDADARNLVALDHENIVGETSFPVATDSTKEAKGGDDSSGNSIKTTDGRLDTSYVVINENEDIRCFLGSSIPDAGNIDVLDHQNLVGETSFPVATHLAQEAKEDDNSSGMTSENLGEPSEAIREINILLMGQSGVGKSTLINSCLNYMMYSSLDELLVNDLLSLIPAKINIEDRYNNQKVIYVNSNAILSEPGHISKEEFADGKAATQEVNVYEFLIDIDNKPCRIRFLDTPGMGDDRGSAKDNENCDQILGYLSQLNEIHGFCILLKPSNPRLDILMNYCLVQILSRLEKSAAKNVCFIFTNTRGQRFKAGQTLRPLQVLLEKIEQQNNLSIPLTVENRFCFDNEAFEYVAAVQNGVELDPESYSDTERSWNVSVNEFCRLLRYVSDLPPHDLKKTFSVNDAQTMVSNLTAPVIEIVQLIQQNIMLLQQHTEELTKARLTKDELNAKMNTTQTDIIIWELEHPNTVCTHEDCVTVHEVNGFRKTHYAQVCCRECIIPVTSGLLGSMCRILCSSFTVKGFCKTCKHPVTDHKHILYETEVFERRTDESMVPAVNSIEDLVKVKEDRILYLNQRQRDYEDERRFILHCCAALDQYLENNSVVSVGNVIEDYLNYEITREKTFKQGPNVKTLDMMQRLLADLKEEKIKLMAGTSECQDITPAEIDVMKDKLMNLKHFGKKIRDLYHMHEKGRMKSAHRHSNKIKDSNGILKGFLNKVGIALVQKSLSYFLEK